ncbi:MAG: hypothetical protein LBH79_07055 [Nitrososphaerota archaeon]|jgi:hypothetical protein|nr:hypothetical protein [Nitrososphaerota archaeon]
MRLCELNTYGVVVRVWADNGQVSTINPMIFNIEDLETNPPANNTAATPLLPTALFVVMLAATIGCCSYVAVVKKQGLKAWKTLPLCGLILFSLLATACQPVTANYLGSVLDSKANGKAEIYASYWEQPSAEKVSMAVLTTLIQARFNALGYDTNRACGTDTNNGVYWNIVYDKLHYARTAVFHFGHMADAANYHCSDGSVVTYGDVNNAANGTPDHHFFTCMWACNTASMSEYISGVKTWVPSTNGLAKSWSQRSGLSADGFSSPDATGSCFIGFHYASPGLTTTLYTDTTVPGFDFIDKFYDYALTTGGYSVHDSLNQASISLFVLPFILNPRWTGSAYTYFPGATGMSAGNYSCQMKVYGNSYVYLRQYYAASYYGVQEYGGFIVDPYYVNGVAPDASYTQIWAWRTGDSSAIMSTMTTSSVMGSSSYFARGHVYIYGYSLQNDIPSCVYVLRSETGSNDWVEINNGYITSETPAWYDIGYANNFKYIAIACYNTDPGWGCNFMADSVRVIP